MKRKPFERKSHYFSPHIPSACSAPTGSLAAGKHQNSFLTKRAPSRRPCETWLNGCCITAHLQGNYFHLHWAKAVLDTVIRVNQFIHQLEMFISIKQSLYEQLWSQSQSIIEGILLCQIPAKSFRKITAVIIRRFSLSRLSQPYFPIKLKMRNVDPIANLHTDLTAYIPLRAYQTNAFCKNGFIAVLYHRGPPPPSVPESSWK